MKLEGGVNFTSRELRTLAERAIQMAAHMGAPGVASDDELLKLYDDLLDAASEVIGTVRPRLTDTEMRAMRSVANGFPFVLVKNERLVRLGLISDGLLTDKGNGLMEHWSMNVSPV